MVITKDYIFQKIKFLIPVLFILYIIYSGFIYSKVYLSAKIAPDFAGRELMRINIFGSSTAEENNTVSATVSIIDSNKNEMAVIERSWNGNYLEVDFLKTTISGKTYIFPQIITAKNQILSSAKKKGKPVKLNRYYDENNECLLLGFNSPKIQKHALYNISSFSNGHYNVFKIGKVQKMTVDLSFCKTGIWYSINVKPDGSLNLERL